MDALASRGLYAPCKRIRFSRSCGRAAPSCHSERSEESQQKLQDYGLRDHGLSLVVSGESSGGHTASKIFCEAFGVRARPRVAFGLEGKANARTPRIANSGSIREIALRAKWDRQRCRVPQNTFTTHFSCSSSSSKIHGKREAEDETVGRGFILKKR